jgi:hypothetical protein
MCGRHEVAPDLYSHGFYIIIHVKVSLRKAVCVFCFVSGRLLKAPCRLAGRMLPRDLFDAFFKSSLVVLCALPHAITIIPTPNMTKGGKLHQAPEPESAGDAPGPPGSAALQAPSSKASREQIRNSVPLASSHFPSFPARTTKFEFPRVSFQSCYNSTEARHSSEQVPWRANDMDLCSAQESIAASRAAMGRKGNAISRPSASSEHAGPSDVCLLLKLWTSTAPGDLSFLLLFIPMTL